MPSRLRYVLIIRDTAYKGQQALDRVKRRLVDLYGVEHPNVTAFLRRDISIVTRLQAAVKVCNWRRTGQLWIYREVRGIRRGRSEYAKMLHHWGAWINKPLKRQLGRTTATINTRVGTVNNLIWRGHPREEQQRVAIPVRRSWKTQIPWGS